MTDSNISKNDLSGICHSLGLSTEGNKTDLVQRLKDFQDYVSHEKNANNRHVDIDDELVISDYPNETTEVLNPETQALRELFRKSNLLDVMSPLPYYQDAGETYGD
ncbi:1047_t:CDS:1 [Racocetra persica]|uniref:1047_t:CDS:1 n=1 Tax=Racocetra persica TaxID=160502 RepID=A0ACA9LFL9_9GLOM|nr:1047_t:CDS:1 [Racocetra persica]